MPDPTQGYKVVRFTERDHHQLKDAWLFLQQGEDMTAFQSFGWMSLANQRAKGERASRLAIRNRYYLVEDSNGTPALIAPLRIHLTALSPDHRTGTHLIGRNGPADYLNMVYRNFDPAALSAALNAAVRDYNQSTIRFERLLTSTAAYQWLGHLPGAVGSQQEAVELTLPSSVLEYDKLLSKSTRQNLRTARNRARTDDITISVEVTRELGGNEADELSDLKNRRESNRRLRGSSRIDRVAASMRQVYRTAMFTPYDEARKAMTGVPNPWVLRVWANGQVCAFAFGLGDSFEGRRTLRVLQVGIDETYGRYSPGLLGLHDFIRNEVESGLPNWDSVDFTRGGERYKYQLGGVSHPYGDVDIKWQHQ